MDTLIIYTDGACSGNPGPGGAAYVILDESELVAAKYATGFHRTTNNRMEILAVIMALQMAPTYLDRKTDKIVIRTDSSIVVGCTMQGWKRKANQDLWEQLDIAEQMIREDFPNIKINFEKVKGHAGDPYNDLADKMAVEATLRPTRKDHGYVKEEHRDVPEAMPAVDPVGELVEQFIRENPQGDTYELACFIYEKGREAGRKND